MNKHPIEDAINFFDDFLNFKFPYIDVPSLSIAIRHEGVLLYSKAFGKSDVENNNLAKDTTLYRVASNSKMFTAVSIMKLKETGKLNLDDTLSARSMDK